MSGIPYGPEEDAIIRALFPVNATHEVAKLIERTPTSVSQRAARLGVVKDPEYLATKAFRFNGSEPASIGRRFQPGQPPANKGRPQAEWMPAESRKRSRATQFKKGRKPQEARNYQPIGAERFDTKRGVVVRKVTDDMSVYPAARWRPVHVLVWEAVNGPVPPGHVCVFKPGKKVRDSALITADRLEVVTRAENMRRNSYWNNYPREVAELTQLRGALTAKINRKRKHREEQSQRRA